MSYNGNREWNPERAVWLLEALVRARPDLDGFAIGVLMYICDFTAYRVTEKSITGGSYICAKDGVQPKHVIIHDAEEGTEECYEEFWQFSRSLSRSTQEQRIILS